MHILARQLVVSFEHWGQAHQALAGIDLDVPEGQWVMLTGHNGSGKSTLLKVLAGQIEPTAGTCTHALRNGNDFDSQYGSDVYHVRQDPLLGTAALLTLGENFRVAVPPSSRMGTRLVVQQTIAQIINQLGMQDRVNQLLRDFSGGERQQVALAIAKLRRPRLLLLDEPFSALDEHRLASGLALVEEISEVGTTIIQVTHDINMALSRGHRTVVMVSGSLSQDLTGDERSHFRAPAELN